MTDQNAKKDTPENEKKDATAESAKKPPVFRDIEDVVSVGALLRPTIVQAISALKPREREELKTILIDVEKELSSSRSPLTERFANVREIFARTFGFAPIWRFIAGRLEETWAQAEEPTVKELSVVSLLVGMMFEETQNQLAARAKSRRSA